MVPASLTSVCAARVNQTPPVTVTVIVVFECLKYTAVILASEAYGLALNESVGSVAGERGFSALQRQLLSVRSNHSHNHDRQIPPASYEGHPGAQTEQMSAGT